MRNSKKDVDKTKGKREQRMVTYWSRTRHRNLGFYSYAYEKSDLHANLRPRTQVLYVRSDVARRNTISNELCGHFCFWFTDIGFTWNEETGCSSSVREKRARRVAYVNRNCRFKLARSIVSMSMISMSQKPISAYVDVCKPLQLHPSCAFTRSFSSSQPRPPAPMIRIFTDPIAAKIYSIESRWQSVVKLSGIIVHLGRWFEIGIFERTCSFENSSQMNPTLFIGRIIVWDRHLQTKIPVFRFSWSDSDHLLVFFLDRIHNSEG